MKQFHFPNLFIIIGSSIKKIGNKLIVFKIAKTNNEMTSILLNILVWPGGNSSRHI